MGTVFRLLQGGGGYQKSQRIPELLAYLIQIVRVNQEFEGSGWAVYDETFCRQAAVSGNQQWSKLNLSLFSLCFTGKGCRVGRCSCCQSIAHTTETCPVTLEEGQSQEERNPTGRLRRTGSQHNAASYRPWLIWTSAYGQPNRELWYLESCRRLGNSTPPTCLSASSSGLDWKA